MMAPEDVTAAVRRASPTASILANSSMHSPATMTYGRTLTTGAAVAPDVHDDAAEVGL
jgi:hypothetical protein